MDLTYYVIVTVFGMCSVALRPCHSLPATVAADTTPSPPPSPPSPQVAADGKRSRSLFQSPHQYHHHHVHGLYDDAMMVDDLPPPPPPPPSVYFQQQQQQQQQELQERILQLEDDLRAGDDENAVDAEAQDPRLSSRARPAKPDSPVYFIRLPPQPYMFVPGYGYVSQPTRLEPPPFTQRPHSPFMNLPINFVSNGKPVGVYTLPQQHQQNQQYQQNQQFQGRPKPHRRPQPTTTTQPPPPQQQPDSPIYNLDKGPYVFNGRPSDVFLLQSAYDNLYSEVLQNIYP